MCKRWLIAVGALVTITCGGSGGGGAGPTAPAEVNLTGQWTGEQRVTSFSGGGCYGAQLAEHLAQFPTAFDWAYTETIEHTGSVMSTRRTLTHWLDHPETPCEEDCHSCESSGSISGGAYTLTDSSCVGEENNAPCHSSGYMGMQRATGGSQTGNVSGNTITGTGESTSDIFNANGDLVGVLTTRYSYRQTR